MMKLDHVTILVGDLDVSIRFYRALPGFTVKKPSGSGYAEAENDGVTLGLFDRAAWQQAIAPVPAPTGNAILQFTVDDPAESFTAAVAAGGKPVRDAVRLPWGSRSAFVADPDGYLLEFYRWE
jgi:catechol 2,3-dioxygenase-like lactoylglutathione lyase family enzyme